MQIHWKTARMNISRSLYHPGTWRGRVQNPQRFVTHCACALVVKLLPCSVRSATLLSTTCRTAGRPSDTSTLVSESEHTPAPTLLLPFPPLNQSSLTHVALSPQRHENLPGALTNCHSSSNLWAAVKRTCDLKWYTTFQSLGSVRFFYVFERGLFFS